MHRRLKTPHFDTFYQSVRRALLVAISIACNATLSAQLAQAASGAFCERYASDAVRDGRDSFQRGCGFNGGRWTANYQEHFRWCRGVSEVFADEETHTRREQLANSCQHRVAPPSNGGRAAHCQEYATRAVSDAQANSMRNCGLTGGMFSPDRNAHYNWCMSVPQSRSNSEADTRAGVMRQRCRPVADPVQTR